MSPSVTIVVPVYNSSQSLRPFFREVNSALSDSFRNFQLIFVDDGSKDESWEEILFIRARDSRVKGIRLSKNYGQHNALLCGIIESEGEIIVTMDDDLQHPPTAINLLISEINKGYDVAYAFPIAEKQGYFRNIASGLTKSILSNTLKSNEIRNLSAFRAFRREFVQSFANYLNPRVNIDVMLAWNANRYSFIPIQFRRRKFGNSSYSFIKLVRHALDMMTGFTSRPIKLVGFLGILVCAAGMALLLFILVSWSINKNSIPGFTFLASIIIIFSGTQLVTLGILGEYIARIHMNLLGKPPFSIKDRV